MSMKKVFTAVLAFCILFCMPVYVSAEDNKNQKEYALPILMYHNIHSKNTGKYTLSPKALEEDIIYLKEQGYTTIVVQDLINYKEKGAPLPAKPIMLTFDDGCTNNYTNVLPLLRKYNVKCVLSTVGAWTDSNYKNGVLDETGSHLNYAQMKEMYLSGLVELQNHTYDLHKHQNGRTGLKRKKGESFEEYKKLLSADLTKWKDKTKQNIGAEFTAVTFPFGAYCESSVEIIKELGYKMVLGCWEKVNHINQDSDNFILHRYNRPAGISTKSFFAKFENQVTTVAVLKYCHPERSRRILTNFSKNAKNLLTN